MITLMIVMCLLLCFRRYLRRFKEEALVIIHPRKYMNASNSNQIANQNRCKRNTCDAEKPTLHHVA